MSFDKLRHEISIYAFVFLCELPSQGDNNNPCGLVVTYVPCKHPGYAILIPHGQMYCNEHKKVHVNNDQARLLNVEMMGNDRRYVIRVKENIILYIRFDENV